MGCGVLECLLSFWFVIGVSRHRSLGRLSFFDSQVRMGCGLEKG